MTSVHYAGYVTSKTLLITVLFIRTDRLSCVNIRVIIIVIIIIFLIVFFLVMLDFPFLTLKLFTIVNSFPLNIGMVSEKLYRSN